MERIKKSRAFTLIELLIVIVIIGILATVIIVRLLDAKNRASDTQIKNNARNIDTALASYRVDKNNVYPTYQTQKEIRNLGNFITDYLPTGVNSAVFNHPSTTEAMYISNSTTVTNTLCPSANTCYYQGWTLSSKTDTAYPGPFTLNGTGDGVYQVCTATGSPYPFYNGGGSLGNAYGCSINSTTPQIRGLRFTLNVDLTATRVFILYGPQ